MNKVLNVLIRTLICVCVLLNTAVAVIAENEETGVLQFYDDFSADLKSWDIQNHQMRVIDNLPKLVSDGPYVCEAKVAGKTTVWSDFTITFGVRAKGNGIFMVSMRQEENSFLDLIIRPGEAVSFRYDSDKNSEALLTGDNYSFEADSNYQIRLVCSGSKMEVYIRKAEEVSYTYVGYAVYEGAAQGKISLRSIGLYTELTDFRIYNDAASDFYFKNKIIKQKQGTISDTIQPVNTVGGESVLYSSDNPGCISVDEEGKLQFSKPGTAVITARTIVNGIYYVDSYDAICTGVLNTFGFNIRQTQMYVGETLNVNAVIRPDSVANRRVQWTSSAPEALEISGEMQEVKSLTAKKPSDNVTVTIQSMDSPNRRDSLRIKILPRPTDVKDISFKQTDLKRQIPEYFFGMHSNPLDGITGTTEKQDIIDREKKFADYYADMHIQFIRFMLNDFNWRKGQFPNMPEGYPSYSMKDIFTAGLENDIPYCIVAADTDSAQDIIDMVSEIKSVSKRPVYIEMGNETFDAAYQKYFPSVAEFTERVKEVYEGVKKVDPSVKIAVPMLGYKTCEDNHINWDQYLLENQQYYDAAVLHLYTGAAMYEHESTSTIMNRFSDALSDNGNFIAEEHALMPGKEIWITEYGDLPRLFSLADYSNDSKYFSPQSESERARLQYGKSVGNAIGYASRLFNFLNYEEVTMASYHYFNDAQCFGVIQQDTKLPNYHMFKKVGEILADNSHYYQLQATDSEDTAVNGWGFGDETKIKQLVFSNTSNQAVYVNLGDLCAEKVWQYGSDNPLPDFGNYKMQYYTDLPSEIPLPKICSGIYKNMISVPPYSIIVANVGYEYGMKPAVDIGFQEDSNWNGNSAVITDGTVDDGMFYLHNLESISTTGQFSDSIIEFDYNSVNSTRLDIEFNSEGAYKNYIYFNFDGYPLYQSFRMISDSPIGHMGDNPFLQNHDVTLYRNKRYRIKIEIKKQTVSFYVMDLETQDPEYILCGILTDERIFSGAGTVRIKPFNYNGQTGIPYRLRIYDIKESMDMKIGAISCYNAEGIKINESARLQKGTYDVSCDIYSYGGEKLGTAICAVYDGDRLEQVVLTPISGDIPKIVFPKLELEKDLDVPVLKIFIWDEEMIRGLAKAAIF
ncbi:MAG: hypothetical protein J6N52_00500 [Clostridia bacterium]|nr:hypothetical protein [Clostridia bacterium]